MKTKIVPQDPLELALFKAMVALVVHRPDGLERIQSALESVEAAGIEMGILRTADYDPKARH